MISKLTDNHQKTRFQSATICRLTRHKRSKLEEGKFQRRCSAAEDFNIQRPPEAVHEGLRAQALARRLEVVTHLVIQDSYTALSRN